MFGLDDRRGDGYESLGAKIRVVAVGGAGGHAVNMMVERNLQGVEFVALNTDAQDLAANLAPTKIQLGEKLTRGLGTGGNAEMGREAALEAADAIRRALQGADLVFLAAGMGGGTGTGATPVVAQIARELGALTVGMVTKPFSFEAKARLKRAEAGIQELQGVVDTLMIVSNERLASVVDKGTFVLDAFRQIDEVLYQAVRAIADLITVHGFINLDFADVRTVMSEKGLALMGCASAAGEDRAVRAAQAAMNSPFLEGVSIQNARGVLINITGSATMTFGEVYAAANLIRQQVQDDANVIFGAVIDETMEDEVRVTVVATGFRAAELGAAPVEVPSSGAAQQDVHATSGANGRPAVGSGSQIPRGAGQKQRVFVGRVEDGENGPVFHPSPPARTLASGRQASSEGQAELPYAAKPEDEQQEDLRIPAFVRRGRG